MRARSAARGHVGRRAALLAAIMAVASALAPGQDSQQAAARLQNPLGRDPAAIKAGDGLFHERCSVCHGQNAQGAMASNLVRTRPVQRGSPGALFELIRKGIPGTEMPPQPDLADERIWQIVSYLRSLALPGEQAEIAGDPEAGLAVFREAGCASCHIIDGSGGFLGPALDSIAVRKSSDSIRADVIDPDSDLAEGFTPVVVETSDGQRIEGVLKNEDSYAVLIQSRAGEFRGLPRAELGSIETRTRSWMPDDYEARLTAEQLQNLLAFLDLQRDPFVPVVRGFGVY